MIRHNARKKKIQRKKVAFIASVTRAKTVKNTNKSISPVVHHKTVKTGIPPDKIITNPFTGHVFVMTNPHRITGDKYGVSIVAYNWVPKNKYKAHPQPTKRYTKHTSPPKMNRVFYMEKLVQHKLSKWVETHPCPATMFAEQVTEWNEKKLSTEEHIRDTIISKCDKLKVTATRLPLPATTIVLATIPDKGETENVAVARKIAMDAMKKDPKILHCQILDHEEKTYRLVA